MQELFSQINTLFQNNQILSTVAGGSVIVWLVSNIKTLWNRLVAAINALISFTIVNTYEDMRDYRVWDSQEIFNKFVSNTKVVWERTKNLDLSTCRGIVEGDFSSKQSSCSLAYGFSIRIMFGKLVFCNRSIDRQQKITVTTTLRVFFASKQKFMKTLTNYILAELNERISTRNKRDQIVVFSGDSFGRKYKRSMDTLFTNNNEHYQLLDSIKDFIDKKEIYRKLSYPYSYSALLYGEPGCGKSSTILAIASTLDKDICYVNPSKMSLDKLLRVLNQHEGEIFVFEDIDAINTAVNSNRGKTSPNAMVGDGEYEQSFPAGSKRCMALPCVNVVCEDEEEANGAEQDDA